MSTFAKNSPLSVLVQSFFSHCNDPVVQSTVAEFLGAKTKVTSKQMTPVELMCGVYNQARHLLEAVIAALSRGTGDGGRILALEEQIGAQAPRGISAVAVTKFTKQYNDAVTAHKRGGGEEKPENVLTALYLKCLGNGSHHAAEIAARVKDKYNDSVRDAGKDSTKSALSLVEVQDLAAVLYAEQLKKSPEPAGGGGKGNDKSKSKNKNKNQGSSGGGRQQGEDGPGDISNGARDAPPPGESSKKKPYHKSKQDVSSGKKRFDYSTLTCRRCGKRGHLGRDCPKHGHQSSAAARASGDEDSVSLTSGNSELGEIKEGFDEMKSTMGSLTQAIEKLVKAQGGFDN